VKHYSDNQVNNVKQLYFKNEEKISTNYKEKVNPKFEEKAPKTYEEKAPKIYEEKIAKKYEEITLETESDIEESKAYQLQRKIDELEARLVEKDEIIHEAKGKNKYFEKQAYDSEKASKEYQTKNEELTKKIAQ